MVPLQPYGINCTVSMALHVEDVNPAPDRIREAFPGRLSSETL